MADKSATPAQLAGTQPEQAAGDRDGLASGYDAVVTGVAVLVGLVTAVLFFWQLHESDSSVCFRQSVEIVVGHEGDPSLNEQTCPGGDFDDVRRDLERQVAKRDAAFEAGAVYVPERPNEGGAKATLLVWMSLLAATAGVAGFTCVKSWNIMSGPPAPRGWYYVVGLAAAGLAAVALLVVFRAVPIDLSDLHDAELEWMTKLVLGLSLPAAVGLVTVWLRLHDGAKTLHDMGQLRSQMQQLIILLGAALSLGVLATAARFEAIAALPGGQQLPSAATLLYGAVFAVMAAAFYVPTHQRWVAYTETLIKEEVEEQYPPDNNPKGTFPYRKDEIEANKRLQEDLGVAGPWQAFQGSFAVLSPIVAAAVSSLFG